MWLLSHALLTCHVFLHFLTQSPAHAFVRWSGSLFAQGYWQLDAGCLCLKLQIDRSWPPVFRTIRLQQWDHSFRYSPVFLQLQSWLCIGMFCRRTIICGSYMRVHVLMSDYSGNESLDSDSDIPTTSSRKQLRTYTGPPTPQFPHPFFLTSIKIIFISVRLAQAFLDRNMSVYG